MEIIEVGRPAAQITAGEVRHSQQSSYRMGGFGGLRQPWIALGPLVIVGTKNEGALPVPLMDRLCHMHKIAGVESHGHCMAGCLMYAATRGVALSNTNDLCWRARESAVFGDFKSGEQFIWTARDEKTLLPEKSGKSLT
jgi:hypothetical protein